MEDKVIDDLIMPVLSERFIKADIEEDVTLNLFCINRGLSESGVFLELKDLSLKNFQGVRDVILIERVSRLREYIPSDTVNQMLLNVPLGKL